MDGMTDNTQKINDMFEGFKKRFLLWLEGKPTGEFSIKIPVNDGGIRGRPDVAVKEKV